MGEMASYLAINGSFVAFAVMCVDPTFGFATGGLVLYNYAVTVAVEATACEDCINYWNDSINSAGWCAIFLSTMLLSNVFGVRWFGEFEFYTRSAKCC